MARSIQREIGIKKSADRIAGPMIESIDDLNHPEEICLHYINQIGTWLVTIIFSPLELNQGSASYKKW